MEWLISKILDLSSDLIWNLLVKFISPIKVTPKLIDKNISDFLPIISISVKNRTNKPLYNVRVVGVSEEKFDVKILGDNKEKGKTVEHMDLNTNVLIAYVTERTTGKEGWILVIHKLNSHEEFIMKIKPQNHQKIHMRVMDYNFTEKPVGERKDGVVYIPFEDKPLPKI